MEFQYKHCKIDCRPEADAGVYIACVQITLPATGNEAAETVYIRNLGSYKDEAKAVARAELWARGWIDENEA